MKIGILTEYYGSKNYGGILQSYALCKALNELGYSAEQIPYYKSIEANNNISKEKINIKKLLSIHYIKKNLATKFIQYVLKKKFANRTKSFQKFRDEIIPHNNLIFDDENLISCGGLYDAYVVGSDQVWNPTFCHPGYMLDFVNNDKIKMSYAASLGVTHFDEKTKEEFRKSLKTYNAISVRENDAINILSELTNKKVECVLDPTLLLTREQWNSVASNRGENQEYIFTYFLGEDSLHRELTTKFAKDHNLKIISMPYIWGRYRLCDKTFGDERLFDVSPQDFIALIKNAKYVFTDSFHAVAFSCIYQKEFFVFQRTDFKGMSTRLENITKMFGAESHFCFDEERMSLHYLNNTSKIDYKKASEMFMEKKNHSIDFIKNNLLK